MYLGKLFNQEHSKGSSGCHDLFLLASIYGNFETALYLACMDEVRLILGVYGELVFQFLLTDGQNPLADLLVGAAIFKKHKKEFANTSAEPIYERQAR